MKNAIFALAFAVVLFGGASVASAAVDCNITPEQCNGNGNPGLISMPWGLTGDQTPQVAAGTSFSDGRGHTFVCPWFFPAGCYDVTRTAWYAQNVLPWLR